MSGRLSVSGCYNGYNVSIIDVARQALHTAGMKTSTTDPDSKHARRPRGRPPVARELIVATALEIVDEAGADALSMRTLAQRLDSGTATLYRHFADRAELVAHVVDRVLGEVDLDAVELRSMSWQRVCARVAQAMFYALGHHPNRARLLTEQVPMGPNAMRMREYCVAALLDDGFSPKVAARSWATLGRYVVGFATQAPGQTTTVLDDARQSSLFQGVDASQFPATARVAKSLPVSLDDEFTFGLDLILTGLSRLERGTGRARSRTSRRAAKE